MPYGDEASLAPTQMLECVDAIDVIMTFIIAAAIRVTLPDINSHFLPLTKRAGGYEWEQSWLVFASQGNCGSV